MSQARNQPRFEADRRPSINIDLTWSHNMFAPLRCFGDDLTQNAGGIDWPPAQMLTNDVSKDIRHIPANSQDLYRPNNC